MGGEGKKMEGVENDGKDRKVEVRVEGKKGRDAWIKKENGRGWKRKESYRKEAVRVEETKGGDGQIREKDGKGENEWKVDRKMCKLMIVDEKCRK